MLRLDDEAFGEKVVKAIEERFPGSTATDENFNYMFTVEFANGKCGLAGIVNGPLEVDIYLNQTSMQCNVGPIGSVFVCDVERKWKYDNVEHSEDELLV